MTDAVSKTDDPPKPGRGAKPPPVDRRASPNAPAITRAVRGVRGALTRPIALERRGNQLHVVLVERRRRPRSDEEAGPTPARIWHELRDRLLASEVQNAPAVMRQLVSLGIALKRKGWAGVDEAPLATLQRAIVQAEIVAGEPPSPVMKAFVDRLRLHLAAAEARSERIRDARAGEPERVEVSETSPEEFETELRKWMDSDVRESEPSALDEAEPSAR